MMAKKKKKMSKEVWFRKYGEKSEWGFIPINWKGWVALVLLIGVNVFAANYFNLNELVFDNWSKFLVVFLLSIMVFVLIARRKTLGIKSKKQGWKLR